MEYEQDYFINGGYKGYRDYDAHAGRVKKLISITHPQSVLDVGCAYGFITRRLLDQGIYAVGMDVSNWCEQIAQNIIPNNFVRHDMREAPYPFRDKEFDVLYCEGVLEHIEEEHIIPIMREFERVSLRRLIQVSFAEHKDVEKEQGHITIKDANWWLSVIPVNTWLAAQEAATENTGIWLYKG
ncbi:MAG: class I SAM-dependent methyltransferase [Dehalococcoidales bacterium]|nr:class I SAM-dependent methyltransferase [Dehalococcoidales bacterium]